MERLTQKDRYGHYYTNEKVNDRMQDDEPYPHAYDGKAIDRLGEYEDAEEQGLLLRLPCKVGDVVYLIQSNGKISERTMDMMFLGVLWDLYGKEWFTSKEQAEQALEEMKEV